MFFDDEAQAAIRAYLEARADNLCPLWLRHDKHRGSAGPNGERWRLSLQSIWKVGKARMAEAGVSGTTHHFRHLKATTLLERGANLSDVQDVLGHAHFETTKSIYAHTALRFLREAVQRHSASAHDLVAELDTEQQLDIPHNGGAVEQGVPGKCRLSWAKSRSAGLEEHSAGTLICLTGGPLVGVLTALVEQATDPSNPVEAVTLARRLNELYPHVFVELAYHGQPREKLVNRGLVAPAQRLDLPLVATNTVRFARARDALAHEVLQAMAKGRRTDVVVRSAEQNDDELPVVNVGGAPRVSGCVAGACKTERQMIWAYSRVIEASGFFPRVVQHELRVTSERIVITYQTWVLLSDPTAANR